MDEKKKLLGNFLKLDALGGKNLVVLSPTWKKVNCSKGASLTRKYKG
jgi:hypothetical protein